MTEQHSPTQAVPSVLVPVDPAIERYMLGLTNRTDSWVLSEMEAFAQIRHFPIVGRLVGTFIETIAKIVGAQRVFEFGSGFGYSAYWFARAVGQGGQVICTDGNPANRIKAERFLTTAGLWGKVDFYTGWAQDIFAATDGWFDICYNDADKGDYPAIWLMARERIRPGGLYIADNVLWHGRVTMQDYVDIMPGWTEAILEHNRMIFNDSDFDAFIDPVRDGVIVARKKLL